MPPRRHLPTSSADRRAAPLRAAGLVPWLALLVLAAAFLFAAHLDGVAVTLTVDGRSHQVRTRAGTVAALVAEAGVLLSPGDLVRPSLSARVRAGDEIEVLHGRPVRIRADGATRDLRSHGRSLLAVLSEAGVSLGPADRANINGRPWPLDRPADVRRVAALVAGTGLGGVEAPGTESAPGRSIAMPDVPSDAQSALPGESTAWTIDVLRAVPFTVVESGLAVSVEASGESLREALANAGIPVHSLDVLHPPADTPPSGGMRVEIRRATPFVVTADGSTRGTRAWADTVGEALERAGVGLKGHDYAIPAAETPLVAGMSVEVVRVVQDVLVQEIPIPFGTSTQPDPARDLDQTAVVRPGEDGLKRQRILISYENGEETAREVQEETVLREPVEEIVAYGTNVVWRTVDTPEGPKRYWRQMRVYATSYSASRSGTPVSAPWYGRTRMGLPARRGIVAVDRRLIPLGTWLYVPGYGVALAGDTGGGIRRYHIDLCFDDDAYESWHRYVDLYLLEPLPPPDDMPWILP